MQIAPWVFPLTEETASVPPHVRGKDTRRQHDESVRGITPACAGKSPSATQEAAWLRDHPRVCREKKPIWKNCSASSGSPPRVRGKVCDASDFGYVFRITPACAGKRSAAWRGSSTATDHPRVCGEKRSASPCRVHPSGSPPRVRGKVFGIRRPKLRDGITPACAGKSAIVMVI